MTKLKLFNTFMFNIEEKYVLLPGACTVQLKIFKIFFYAADYNSKEIVSTFDNSCIKMLAF